MQFCDIKKSNGVGTAVKEQRFCMLLKLNCYKCRFEYYNFRMLIFMVNTKKIAIQCTQKEVKEFKHFTTKSTKH